MTAKRSLVSEPDGGESGGTTVELGIAVPFSAPSVSVLDVAPAVAERGFESLWVGEHTHLPVASTHRYTTGSYGAGRVARDGFVPDMYKRFPDPFVTLTGAASVTTTLRLGTAISLVAEHSPILLAKTVASLDELSRGRMTLGVGFGWNPLEMQNNGCDPDRRHDVAREHVLAMQRLWTDETASFAGEFVRFTESWSYPKPVQRPHPPVLVGAGPGTRAFEAIVEWADGWMPVAAMVGDRVGEHIERLRTLADERGRGRAAISVTVIEPAASFAGKRDHAAFVAHLPRADDVERWRAAGVDRLVVRCPNDASDRVFAALDALVALREAVALT